VGLSVSLSLVVSSSSSFFSERVSFFLGVLSVC